MNPHHKSLLGEISALGTILLTLALFVIGLPAIFLVATKPQKSNQQEYVEASVSS